MEQIAKPSPQTLTKVFLTEPHQSTVFDMETQNLLKKRMEQIGLSNFSTNYQGVSKNEPGQTPHVQHFLSVTWDQPTISADAVGAAMNITMYDRGFQTPQWITVANATSANLGQAAQLAAEPVPASAVAGR